jgi:hypothetical protein
VVKDCSGWYRRTDGSISFLKQWSYNRCSISIRNLVDNPAIQYMYNKGRRHHRPFRCSVRTLFYFPWQENKPPLAQMKERSGMIHPPKAVADKTAPDSLSHPLHSYVSEREGSRFLPIHFPIPKHPPQETRAGAPPRTTHGCGTTTLHKPRWERGRTDSPTPHLPPPT